MSFEEFVKAKPDLPVFRLSDGTVSQNLRKTFKKLMIDTGLLTCPRTGQNRTLYSFRHTYATFALLNDGHGHTHAGDTDGHQHCYDRAALQPSYTAIA